MDTNNCVPYMLHPKYVAVSCKLEHWFTESLSMSVLPITTWWLKKSQQLVR